MKQMNLEFIIKSEVSQKDKYCILTHAYGIEKDGTVEHIFRAAMEKQTQRTDLWKEEKVRQIERVAWKHIHYRM